MNKWIAGAVLIISVGVALIVFVSAAGRKLARDMKDKEGARSSLPAVSSVERQ